VLVGVECVEDGHALCSGVVLEEAQPHRQIR
jgi:hypothetical protein